jgi:ketol-acid reductoisomerase
MSYFGPDGCVNPDGANSRLDSNIWSDAVTTIAVIGMRAMGSAVATALRLSGADIVTYL